MTNEMESPEQKKFDSSSKSEIFSLLSNHRRRHTIRICEKRNEPVSLSELAEQIAAWEQDKAIEQITSAERKRVYTSLQQTHLDRLEEAGMIRYETDEIELTDRAQNLNIYLDIVPESSISWGVYYLGLSVLWAVVVATLWSGTVPSSSVNETAIMAFFLLVYGGSAVAHIIFNRRYQLDNTVDSIF